MKKTSIMLGKEHMAFIKSQVRKGRFHSASETVRAGLQMLKEQELRLERLRAALREGEASGEPTPFDFHEFIATKKAQPR
jgi:antitoxin ParD1/3/4